MQLTPELSLSDVPFVIPALRMQQSRLTYLCDASRMPNASLFTKPLEYIHNLSPQLEGQIYKSEETLQALIERLSRMGLGDSVTKWLDGDACNSFFEFRVANTPELDRCVCVCGCGCVVSCASCDFISCELLWITVLWH